MSKLMWVSEWRIVDSTDSEKEYDWYYRVSNGGVYTNATTWKDAKKKLSRNIEQEKNRYLINQLTCPSCNKLLSQHSGSISYERCLTEICLRKVAYV